MRPTLEAIESNAAPKAIGPYSQAMALGDLVFCSGQICLDPETQQMVGSGNIEAETKQVLRNLAAVLKAAGSSLDHVVFATIYLTDLGAFDAVNRLYGEVVSQEFPPARATVEVSRLPKDASVEISVIACRNPSV